MDYEITLAEDEIEIESVYQIMQDAFREYNKYDTPSSAMTEKLSTLQDSIHTGAEQAVIGYMNGKPVGSLRFKDMDEVSLYFFRLSVIPEARGKGIAKKMIEWLAEYARASQKDKIMCRVRKDTPHNIRFYQSNNFDIAKEETIINKDGNVVDTVMMEKGTKVFV
ncbi:GNAT family N-acetyltransferase [Niallia oryzisoli]|uniref:GNAT family N-acetyltransferase n=1 Tax=Niallia oryzisoli TaxID=1737571 RepID=A0ABZ2CK95_9BACI